MSRSYKLGLSLIVLLALVLRVVGITHGFPFIFHPDEPTVVRSALGLRFNPNPGHFDWPHLFIYLNYFLYMGFAKLRSTIELWGLKSYIPGIVWNDNLIFYLLTRLFAAVLGALTTVPIFLSGRKLFGEKCGFFSALVFAILPFHVWHSHYSLIDVPMVFFLAWAVYFSAGIFVQKNIGNYILAGLFVGFAGSTKYNGALGALVIIVAHIYRILNAKDERLISKNAFFNLFIAGFFCILGFVVGTPYAVLDYTTFIRTDGPKGALWQFTNVGRVGFFSQIQQFVGGSVSTLPVNLGITFWILYLAGFFYTILNLKKDERLRRLFCLYLVSLFYFFYVSGLEKTRAQYFMIIYPLFALVVGYLINLFLVKLLHNKLKTIFLALVFLAPLSASITNSLTFVKKDTRNLLYDWLNKEVLQEDILIYDGADLDSLFESGLIKNEIKKSKSDKVLAALSTKGYLIVSKDEDGMITIDSKKMELSEVPIKQISDKGRRGPFIEIYKAPITSDQ